MSDAINPLAQQLAAQLPLKAEHLPPEIGAWPPAPGWWLLALLVLVLVVLGWRRWQRYRNHPVTAALKELKRIEQDPDCADCTRQALACSILLRRTAISLYPRAEVAALTGQPWLDFLCETSVKRPMGHKEAQALIRASYQLGATYNTEAVLQWLRRWLKAQRRRQG